jgi:hypothetical protein
MCWTWRAGAGGARSRGLRGRGRRRMALRVRRDCLAARQGIFCACSWPCVSEALWWLAGWGRGAQGAGGLRTTGACAVPAPPQRPRRALGPPRQAPAAPGEAVAAAWAARGLQVLAKGQGDEESRWLRTPLAVLLAPRVCCEGQWEPRVRKGAAEVEWAAEAGQVICYARSNKDTADPRQHTADEPGTPLLPHEHARGSSALVGGLLGQGAQRAYAARRFNRRIPMCVACARLLPQLRQYARRLSRAPPRRAMAVSSGSCASWAAGEGRDGAKRGFARCYSEVPHLQSARNNSWDFRDVRLLAACLTACAVQWSRSTPHVRRVQQGNG